MPPPSTTSLTKHECKAPSHPTYRSSLTPWPLARRSGDAGESVLLLAWRLLTSFM